MKRFQRIVAMLLCLVSLLGMFSGCTGAPENSDYATKGEFFAMFISEKGLYSDVYTDEEIAENETYELEAEVMYEWMLIDEDQKGDLDDAATKELVTQVCVRFMSFREEGVEEGGEAPTIKDISKCHDQQAITDAVTMGMATLENGYFDANEKMSYDACYAVIEKMEEIDRTAGMDAGELEVEYVDGVELLDVDELGGVEFIYEEEEAEELTDDGEDAQLSLLSSDDGTMQITSLASTNASSIKIKIDRLKYDANPTKYGKGKVLLYDPNTLKPAGIPKDLTDFRPFAGEITKVQRSNTDYFVTLTLKPREVSKLVKDNNGINKTSTSVSKVINEQSVQTEDEEGFSLKKTSSGKGIVATFKHTFSLSDKFYKKQTWRNAQASPSITIKATVENFKITTKNLGKLLLGANTTGEVRIDFDTTVDVTATAGGLRYSPPNNGNGGALANFKNSRWTGASAGGSDKIKLGKADIPIGSSGLCVTCVFYLYVQMDGSLHVTATVDNSYLLSMKKTWYGSKKVSITDNSSKPSLTEMEANANISAGVLAEPGVSFWGQTIMDASVKAGFVLGAKASIYSKQTGSAEKNSVYATQAELDELTGYSYCIDTRLDFALECTLLTEKSILGQIIKNTYKKPIEVVSQQWTLGTVHFEDGKFMSSCSRSSQAAVEVNSDEEIYLDTYKVNLSQGEGTHVSITSVPMNDTKIKNAGGVVVTSGNKNVVKVTYDKNTKTIDMDAVGEGSTEITVKIKKSKNSKKYYEQQISVTVSSAKATASTGQTEENFDWNSGQTVVVMDLPRKYLYC